MDRTRSTPEDVWEVTTEAVWKGLKEIQKLYWKDLKNYIRCMERTRSTQEDCMESDYRSKDGKNRKIQKNTEVVWKGPEIVLQKKLGSDYRSSVVRLRRTTEAVFKRPEELQKLYWKDLQNYRSCMERTRSTPEGERKVTAEAVG
jgi:hypothetical protein